MTRKLATPSWRGLGKENSLLDYDEKPEFPALRATPENRFLVASAKALTPPASQ